MEKIAIYKTDEVYLRIECEDCTKRELYGHFAKYAKNHIHDIRFKRGNWNGKIAFFNSKDGTLPIGLLAELMNFAKIYRYSLDFKFDTSTMYDKDFTKDELLKYIEENLTLPFVPRDYQIDSIVKALKRKRGICLMPTSCMDKDTKIKARIDKKDLELLK